MAERVTLKREELYAQVWAEPVTRLAARYGIIIRDVAMFSTLC